MFRVTSGMVVVASGMVVVASGMVLVKYELALGMVVVILGMVVVTLGMVVEGPAVVVVTFNVVKVGSGVNIIDTKCSIGLAMSNEDSSVLVIPNKLKNIHFKLGNFKDSILRVLHL